MDFKQTQKQKEHFNLISNHRYVMAYGGGRSGKTINTLVWMIMRANFFAGARQVVVRSTLKTCRETIFDLSFREALRMVSPNLYEKIEFNKTDLTATFHNGSVILFVGVDENRLENILGQEFCTIYINECSQIHSYNIVAQLMTRLSQKVTNGKRLKKEKQTAPMRMLFDMNPPSKSHWSYKAFIELVNPTDRTPWDKPDEWAAILMNPLDNAQNLPADYIDNLNKSLDAKTRARMIDGQFSTEVENALFKPEWIAKNRVHTVDIASLRKIVVAVDPAVTSGASSDETGIVVAGIDENDHIYVLADRSLKGTPDQWARAVAQAYDDYSADVVIAEVNQGGDLVKSNLRLANGFMKIETVHASRGKIIRAEPVSALYETNRVSHVGHFQRLEEQLESFSADYNRTKQGSPDRLDALVYACTALAVKNSKPNTMKVGAIAGF